MLRTCNDEESAETVACNRIDRIILIIASTGFFVIGFFVIASASDRQIVIARHAREWRSSSKLGAKLVRIAVPF